MAGLGLTRALGLYQQGLGLHQQQQDRQRQQQQIAKQEARQAQLEAANKAAAGFIEQTRAKASNPEQWQPDDDTMFQAGAVRSRELARAGLFEDLAQNEVALEKQRMRARGSALQTWRLKRDPKFIAQAYSTIPDGGTVQDMQPLDGGKRFKVKFSTGVEQEIDPEQLAGALEASLVDPQKSAALSIQRGMEEALIAARTKARLGEIDSQHKANVALAEANNKARADRTEDTNDSRERQAEMRVKGGLQEAKIRADARVSGGGAASIRGEDGLTPSERIRAIQQQAIIERDNINTLSSQLAKTYKKEDKARLEAELKGARERAAALSEHLGKLDLLGRGSAGAGLANQAPSPAAQPGQTSGGSRVTPEQQSARDAVAGALMIRSEFGGDINRAKQELEQMRGGALRAPPGEARNMLAQQAARLEAGIKAMDKGGLKAAQPGAQTKPAQPSPPASLLKDGVHTKFKNGQVWTLRNGQAVRVQ